MHHLESGGIVIMDGKVLLRKTAKNEWLFPKGHVEQGENLQQAAEREIKEETGILSKVADYLGKIDYTFKGDTYEVHFFLMRPIGNTDTWFQHRNIDSFLFPPEMLYRMLCKGVEQESMETWLG